MRNILVVGQNSYIGENFRQCAGQHTNLNITTVSSRDNQWQAADFSTIHTVLFVAGIAHIKQTKQNKQLYFDVNCHLAINVAKHAQNMGVGHFVYISSLAAMDAKPGDYYGSSKRQAEKALQSLTIPTAIIRPPMVYGKDCPGNFSRLIKLAKILPVFPQVNNRRSMIYIHNLSQFLCHIITRGKTGTFTPQNPHYVSTSHMVSLMGQKMGKKIRLSKILSPIAFISKYFVPSLGKLFGNLAIPMAGDENSYATATFEESILESL